MADLMSGQTHKDCVFLSGATQDEDFKRSVTHTLLVLNGRIFHRAFADGLVDALAYDNLILKALC